MIRICCLTFAFFALALAGARAEISLMGPPANTWSQFPATQPVNSGGYAITNVSTITLTGGVGVASITDLRNATNGLVATNMPDVSLGMGWRFYSGAGGATLRPAAPETSGMAFRDLGGRLVAYFTDVERNLCKTNGAVVAEFADMLRVGPDSGTNVAVYPALTNIPNQIGAATNACVQKTGSTMTGNLTMSGGNIALGTNWLSGDGGAEGVYVAADGKVGVGTSAPVAAAHVTAGIPELLRLHRTSDFAAMMLFTNNSGGTYVGRSAGLAYGVGPRLDVSDSPYIVVTTNAAFSVGIGTNAPAARLHVNGNFYRDGVNGWSVEPVYNRDGTLTGTNAFRRFMWEPAVSSNGWMIILSTNAPSSTTPLVGTTNVIWLSPATL